MTLACSNEETRKLNNKQLETWFSQYQAWRSLPTLFKPCGSFEAWPK